jgi:hypothetical protein
MTIFSDFQARVLKSCWIPALLAAIVQILYPVTQTGEAAPIFQNALLTLTLVWEFLVRRAYRAALLLAAACILVLGAGYLLNLHGSNIYGFAALLLLVITRFYLAGTEDRFWPGLIAAMVYFFIPTPGAPGIEFITGTLIGLSILPEQARPFLPIPALLLAAWYRPVSYYVTVYLTENSYYQPACLQKLQSKIGVWGRWEYFFLFITCWFIYIGCVLDLAAAIRSISSPASPGILQALVNVFYIYLSGFLLRNIIVARLLTAGKHNLWLYALHNIPLLNMIPLGILLFTGTRNHGSAQNAADYYQTPRNRLGAVVIGAGIAITLYNIYNMLVVPTGLRLPVISVLALLYIAKIVAFIRLPAGRTAVYALTGLNVATVAFSLDKPLFLYFGLIYLSYYFLMELFYPQLGEDDSAWLSVAARVGEEDEL